MSSLSIINTAAIEKDGHVLIAALHDENNKPKAPTSAVVKQIPPSATPLEIQKIVDTYLSDLESRGIAPDSMDELAIFTPFDMAVGLSSLPDRTFVHLYGTFQENGEVAFGDVISNLYITVADIERAYSQVSASAAFNAPCSDDAGETVEITVHGKRISQNDGFKVGGTCID